MGRAALLSNGVLAVSEANTDLFEFMRDDPDPFARLPYTPVQVDVVESGGGNHQAIYANFVAAIQDGVPLVADGAQGRMSLELANALILSSHTGRSVDLPLDRPIPNLLNQKRHCELFLIRRPQSGVRSP
jgi:predicted dehydrogenase